MLTVAAFLFLGLLVVTACEATRGQFVRLLADIVPPAETVPSTTASPNLKERDA